jgi:predicted aldo/keto reductase-like oxidoreductase
MYNNSFENLQVDYIDYYLAHNLGNHANFRERYIDNGILDFLFREKEAGRIRSLGWSFHGNAEFMEDMAKNYPWDFTLINFNYMNYQAQPRGVPASEQYRILAENNVPIWIMGPLMGGNLAELHLSARAKLAQTNPNASTASWAMRFAGSSPNVMTVLSGMTFMDHLKDNIHTFSPLVPLTPEERRMLLEDITEIANEFRNINCTRCQYCMPCPYGVDIPEILIQYNRSMNEGNYPINPQSADFRRARRAFLIGMDRRVPRMRQADRCINCRLCIGSCPQRINIPAQLRRISRFVNDMKMEV